MAWETIETIARGSTKEPMEARAALTVYRPGSAAKLIVTISDTIMKEARASIQDRFEVMIGTGEHRGLLRLRKNNAERGILSPRMAPRGPRVMFDLGHLPHFPNRAEKSQRCRADFVDGFIEVVLPPWADQKALPAPTVNNRPRHPDLSLEEIAASLRKPRRGLDVTASVMGDPPPERSALANRKPSEEPVRDSISLAGGSKS